jgi:hypothetical protein
MQRSEPRERGAAACWWLAVAMALLAANPAAQAGIPDKTIRQVRGDGRALPDFYSFQVKKPEESAGPWDDYKLVRCTCAADAFRPLAEGGYPLARSVQR